MDVLTQRIMLHEGFTEIPMPDAKGMYVVGFGHDIAPSLASEYANGISQENALSLLNSDIYQAKLEVSEKLPWISNLSQARQEVLFEMAFQLGINGLLEFKDMLSCAENSDNQGVYNNMLSSEWYKETPDRCQELANLWINNQ